MFRGIASRALAVLALFVVVCGALYTLAVTGIAQLVFPYQANGSLITIDGVTYGSELIGQRFEDERHMWGRIQDLSVVKGADGALAVYAAPSNRTPASDYDDEATVAVYGASYERTIARRVEMIRAANPDADLDAIPVDLVTGSGSGLDPHISRAAAAYQVPRLVQATGKSAEELHRIIDAATTGKFLGVFGEDVVNVLEVNLMLDGIMDY